MARKVSSKVSKNTKPEYDREDLRPFDVIGDISADKKRLVTVENASAYNAFLTNRAFSYHPDTILSANKMNSLHALDKIMQHDYLFYSIRKKRRYSKWFKREIVEDITLLSEYLECSYQRAKEVMPILSKEVLLEMTEKAKNLREEKK
jgi:hypothetical protein